MVFLNGYNNLIVFTWELLMESTSTIYLHIIETFEITKNFLKYNNTYNTTITITILMLPEITPKYIYYCKTIAFILLFIILV